MSTTKKQQAIVSCGSKSRKAILLVVALGIIVSLSVASSYASSSSIGSYKQILCMEKTIEFAQKGIIRDVGGFNGAIYECTHMNYANSIYGDVLSSAVADNKGL